MVFVGYGLKIPEQNYDDLAGLDLKGKVVVIFCGFNGGDAGSAVGTLSVGGERWKVFGRRGEWRDLHSESGFDGYSMVAHDGEPHASRAWCWPIRNSTTRKD